MNSESAREGKATGEADVDDRDEVDVDDDSDDAAHVGEHGGDTADLGSPDGDTDGADTDGADTDGDGAEAGTVEGDGAEAVSDNASASRFPGRLLYGTAALALAAVVVAAVFGVMWLVAATGDDASLASSREDVSDSATDAIKAVTEVDYKDPDRYFERSKAASTDDFGKQLTQAEDQFRKMLSKVKTRVHTDVTDVAVQDLNDHEGSATFLAVASTHISQQEDDATKVLRLKGQMKRGSEDADWKLAGLSQVPVVGNGAGAAQPGQNGKQQKDGDTQQGSGQGSGAGN